MVRPESDDLIGMESLRGSNKYKVGGAVLIAAAAVGVYYYYYHLQTKSTANYAPVEVAPKKEEAHSAKKGVLVYLYAEWCGHCQDMMGEWAQVERTLKGRVPTVKIESSDPRMDKFQVQGFPTLRVYPQGLEQPDNYTEYKGRRKADEICSFAVSLCK